MVAMIEFSPGALLVASIRFAELAAAGTVTTPLTAIALPTIAVTADRENLAAPGGMAGPSTKDEFQGAYCPFPKVGLDNGPCLMAG